MTHRILQIIFLIIACFSLHAQDPHFSQFFMAPQFINPALAGHHYGDWQVMSNMRTQWANAGTPFNTETIVGDYKIIGKEENENTLSAGLAFMSDQSMNGLTCPFSIFSAVGLVSTALNSSVSRSTSAL